MNKDARMQRRKRPYRERDDILVVSKSDKSKDTHKIM